ncbi:MAG: hypothetical protein ACO29O_03325, partial [Chitinophagaceae bacterium]
MVFLFLFHLNGTAQINFPSNLRTKFISTNTRESKIDTLSIIPGSFSIHGYDTMWYALDAIKSKLSWKKIPPIDSVKITYRVFPLYLVQGVQRMSFDTVMGKFLLQPIRFANQKEIEKNGFDFGNLTYNGSFGRSLAFGNRQDV